MSAGPEKPIQHVNSGFLLGQYESVAQHRHPVARFRINSALVFMQDFRVSKGNASKHLLNSEEN